MTGGVLLAGGGTAGHVNPLLALASELRRREPGLPLLVLGTSQGLEARLVPQAGFELAEVPKVPLPRRVSADWLRFPGRFQAAIRAAEAAIDAVDAQVVAGFGGYVSTPAYLAARRRSIPVVVHEGNFRPGLANRLGARWAAAVAVTFPGTKLAGRTCGPATVTGLPLRAAIATLDRGQMRHSARAQLGLDPGAPALLVTGGSLGAQKLNETMMAIAPSLLASGAQVLHLSGAGKGAAIEAALAGVSGAERYHVREYLDQMELAYAACDLVVCRAGAGTVCELSATGMPAIFVPLPFGNGEQRLNCRAMVQAGGAQVCDDADFTPGWAASVIVPLLADAARLRQMGQAALSSGIADGASRLADLVRGVSR